MAAELLMLSFEWDWDDEFGTSWHGIVPKDIWEEIRELYEKYPDEVSILIGSNQQKLFDYKDGKDIISRVRVKAATEDQLKAALILFGTLEWGWKGPLEAADQIADWQCENEPEHNDENDTPPITLALYKWYDFVKAKKKELLE